MSASTKLLCMGMTAILLWPQGLWAQGRKSVYLQDPGILSTVGNSARSTQFGQYSYGLGSVSRYGSGYASDVLRSSIGNAASYDITRRTANAGNLAGLADLLPPPSRNYLKGPGTMDLSKVPNLYGPGALSSMLKAANRNVKWDSTAAYLAAIQNDPASRPSSDQVITSLVPSEPSMYKTFMARGETAFRAGDFLRAFAEFELANDIGGRDWMSLVSMLHARFASSAYSFYSSADYARQTLRCFPELPLVPLRPREFYGDKNKYGDGILQLENRVDEFPYDADAPFVLAFFRWFEPNPVEAQKALAKAYAASKEAKNAEKTEACEMFWRGMVRSGQVSGALTPATLPARLDSFPTSSSQPADPDTDAQVKERMSEPLEAPSGIPARPPARSPAVEAKPAD